jgi:hypothetical protein
LVEGLDIVESRRRIVLGVAGLIIVVGLLLALLAPGLLPPTALVGAAVAIVALLAGVAAAIVVDSSDLRVRGPRHVVAAGGELVAVLPVAEDAEAADEFAAVVLEARQPDRSMLLGLAASSLDIAATLRWTDALGVALARRGVSVLRVDLASGRSDAPGLAEVAAGEQRLTEVVDYEPGMMLARLGAGDDHREALAALADLPAKLPRDLQVLLVALPIAASRGVVQAARGLDHVLVVAERGDTSRVDLIAGLDALRAADLQAQVILLDELTASRIASGGSSAEVVPVRTKADAATGEVVDEDPGDEPQELATQEIDEQATAGPQEAGIDPASAPAASTGSTVALEPASQSEPEPASPLEPEGEAQPELEQASPLEPEGEAQPELEQASPLEPEGEAQLEPVPASPLEPESASEPESAQEPEQVLQPDTALAGAPPAPLDDEPDADGPPPPPAAALGAAADRTSGGEPGPADDPTVRLAPSDATSEANDPTVRLAPSDATSEANDPTPDHEPADAVDPDDAIDRDDAVDPDDASARAAAIVRAVLADHRGTAGRTRELTEADRGTPRE